MARQRNPEQPSPLSVPPIVDTFRRLDPRVQLVVVALLVLAAVAFTFAWIEYQRRATPPTGAHGAPLSVHMMLGNPSSASDDIGTPDNFLMLKTWFALSYNSGKGIPNWVSWRVTAADLGTARRKEDFDADPDLPLGFNIVTSHDYDHSGFDRGHMCPHSDRGASLEMSFSTFIMTNIIPQAPNVNRKAWEQLESYGRELIAQEHDRLYIIAGPAGQGGRGSRGFMQSLAGGKVSVPAECWKIIVCVPDDGSDSDDAARISTATRVIAVLMPNDDEKVGENWAGFRTSPATLERETGFHFFDRVRPDVAQTLRLQVDNIPIPPPRQHHYSEERRKAG